MVAADEAPRPGAYDFTRIEAKWRSWWDEHGTFTTRNPGQSGFDASRPKFYVLDMFPYPSGAGLHVGHPIGYIATDIFARFQRMRGYNVLHPMGFDAFGLPAEQYAIETGVHPAITTRKNIETYRRQLRLFGFSYDWSREISTCEPQYYRWTQWIFLQLYNSWYDEDCEWTDAQGRHVRGRARPIAELITEFEWGRRSVAAPGSRAWHELSAGQQQDVLSRHRLAYLDEVPVNWCPALGTVLANEEVTSEGRSERGDHPVYRRPLRQWMMRITRYADRLLSDLEQLDWPEPIKLMQRNWIGRSEGAVIHFPLIVPPLPHGRGSEPRASASVSGHAQDGSISVFTTRPDTVFGATYMVLAPEHPLVEKITTPAQREAVAQYMQAARNRTELERTAESKEKTGVFTGAYAINPLTSAQIPIWIADYVLMGYGTGAIMAVPGSDERDFEFARAFDLPIVAVVSPSEEWMLQRVQAKTTGIEALAKDGLTALRAQAPDLSARIDEHLARAAQLDQQTARTLLERVGLQRLIDHRNRHPQAWGAAFCDEGVTINSPAPGVSAPVSLNGLPTPEAKRRIIEWLEATGNGHRSIKYKLRDWIFSRQKYWGEPFPILHGPDGEIVALDESELPVELPPMEDFRPRVSDDPNALPAPPLARATDWVRVQRRDPRTGTVQEYRRDTNTMPQWAGSCWYYLRYLDPGNERRFCEPASEQYWMPVDLYVGGAEHAVLHLLYARFWHKVLYDLSHVSTPEPFQKLINQGMVLSFAYQDRAGRVHGGDKVVTPGTAHLSLTTFPPNVVIGPAVAERADARFAHRETGEPLTQIVAKMSKALKNVVNPDEIIAEYGADTFRVYEMYMGPIEASKPWNTRDIPGPHRLLHRVWRLVVDEQTGGLSPALVDEAPDEPTLRLLHKTIKKVTEDVEAFKFNTAIAALFDFVNAIMPVSRRPRSVIEPFLLLLAPFAPHLAEELWQRLGHAESLAHHPWPAYDAALARDLEIEVAVQISGKLRSRVRVPADADDAALQSAALQDEKIRGELAGKTVRKVIVVKGRLVNIVAV